MKSIKMYLSITCCSILLLGCNDPKEATQTNFETAISQYLAKADTMCLAKASWPVHLSKQDMTNSWPTGEASQMAALETAGLVLSTHTANGTVYDLTDQGKKYTNEKGSLCYGKETLKKIVEVAPVVKLGEAQGTTARYTTNIIGLASWASRPEIQKAYPWIGEIIKRSAQSTQKANLKLTQTAWVATGDRVGDISTMAVQVPRFP